MICTYIYMYTSRIFLRLILSYVWYIWYAYNLYTKYDTIIYAYFILYILILNIHIIFAKISNKAEVRELAASNWISTTCRGIQTAIIKTCAYNNRFGLKYAFRQLYMMCCTQVQFILRLPMMSIFHQLQVDTVHLPSLESIIVI